jgi:hypothetical protein
VRVVSVKTTMQCLDLERRKERIREKRRKNCNCRLLQARQCRPRPGMQRIVLVWGVGENVGVSES